MPGLARRDLALQVPIRMTLRLAGLASGVDGQPPRATESVPQKRRAIKMPFDGNAERSAPAHSRDTRHNEPPIEARIIDEALKILGPNGEKWIQGREADEKRRHCMIGAIKLARRRLKVTGDDTERLILHVLCRDGQPGPLRVIEAFNDKRDRSFHHVREVFLLAQCEALSRARRGGPAFADLARILGVKID